MILILQTILFLLVIISVFHFIAGLFIYLICFKFRLLGRKTIDVYTKMYVDLYPRLSRYFNISVDSSTIESGEGLLILMFANKGTGKTTVFSKMIQNATRGRKDPITKTRYTHVFSNVPVYGANKFDVEEWLGKRDMPQGSVIYIDEGALELPNTVPLSKEQALFLILQRHAKCTIYIISQSHEDINIKLRRLYQRVFFLKRGLIWGLIGDFTTMVEYKKELIIDEETHQFVEGYFKTWPLPYITRFFTYRPFWYKYFDSYDMPKLKDGPVPLEPWNVELPPTLYSKVVTIIELNYQKITRSRKAVVRKQHSIENHDKSFPLENESGTIVRLGGKPSTIATQTLYMQNDEK